MLQSQLVSAFPIWPSCQRYPPGPDDFKDQWAWKPRLCQQIRRCAVRAVFNRLLVAQDAVRSNCRRMLPRAWRFEGETERYRATRSRPDCSPGISWTPADFSWRPSRRGQSWRVAPSSNGPALCSKNKIFKRRKRPESEKGQLDSSARPSAKARREARSAQLKAGKVCQG